MNDMDKTKDQLIEELEKLRKETANLKKTKTKLQDSEKKFIAITDYTANVEEWYSPEGKLAWISPSVQNFLGYTPQECLEMSDYISTIIHPDHHEMIQKKLDEMVNNLTSGKNLEYKVLRKDGSSLWISTSWQPIYIDGEYAGIRISNQDISEKKKYEFKLIKSLKEKELILKEVHHRIKNNMAAIKSLVIIA